MTYSKLDHIEPWELRFTGSEDTIRVNPSDPIRKAEYDEVQTNTTEGGINEIEQTNQTDWFQQAKQLHESAVARIIKPLMDQIHNKILEQANQGKGSLWLTMPPFNTWNGDGASGCGNCECNSVEFHVCHQLRTEGFTLTQGRYNGKPAFVIQWAEGHCPIKKCYY